MKQAKLGGLEAVNEVLMFLPHHELGDITPDPSNRLDKENHNHIKRLRKSMRDNGFSKGEPIIIGSDLVIKDGHHRYYAAKEEGCGIWIKVDDKYDLKTISRMKDIRKPWSTLSWIKKYANEGLGDYPKIQKFIDKYGYGVKVNLMILTNTQHETPQEMFDCIRMGEFTVDNWGRSHEKAGRIKDFSPFFLQEKDHKNTYFAASVLKCLKTTGYKHDLMMAKVKVQTRKLRLQRNRRDNLEMLQEIYNYKRPKGKRREVFNAAGFFM